MDLSGKTALVTGAAHRVGRGIALDLASHGCNIIVHYGQSAEKASQTVADIRALGREAEAFSVDLRNPDAIQSFIEDQLSSYSVEILVNSAASFVKGKLISTELADWDTSMNINARAPFLLIKYLQPELQSHQDSLIVNIADLSGINAWENFGVHGMSKAALLQLTKVAARELAPSTRVNAIIPGAILPPPGMTTTDPVWQDMVNAIPLNRSGTPGNIGQTVRFLAENDFITGAVINVDGGEELTGAKNH